MKLVQCPDLITKIPGWHGYKSIFLAGGITGCGNWQDEITEMFKHTNLIVCNPRRADYVDNTKPFNFNEEEQVKWERGHINECTGSLFWFPSSSVCPIALFELGTLVAHHEHLFIGADPAYPKRENLFGQLKLFIREPIMYDNIQTMANAVIVWSHLLT
jgi:hypothetical protein